MPSITPMMSAIFCDAVVDALHRLDHLRPTTSPPLHRHRRWRRSASWLAWRALSAFCLTVEPSSSIDAAVSSSALACCSVRWHRSSLPWAIWALDGGHALGALAHRRRRHRPGRAAWRSSRAIRLLVVAGAQRDRRAQVACGHGLRQLHRVSRLAAELRAARWRVMTQRQRHAEQQGRRRAGRAAMRLACVDTARPAPRPAWPPSKLNFVSASSAPSVSSKAVLAETVADVGRVLLLLVAAERDHASAAPAGRPSRPW